MAYRQHDHGRWIDSQPVFRYQPLDTTRKCIRLLKVLPAADHAPIRCQVSHVSLDDRPCFIALSYRWDPSGGAHKNILCNEASMRVGKNLWDFLHRYSKRQAYTEAYLWVDAICIDQVSLREKNHQVSLMRRIYSRAQAVITWLGEPKGDEKISSGIKMDASIHNATRVRDAMEKLFSKHYWSRVWIVQEFILPRTVYIWYGSFVCNGDDFDQPWPTSVLTGLKSHHHAYTVLMHRKMWLNRTALSGSAGVDAFQLCELIRTFGFSQATETRDHIYGFLGLASAAAKSDAYIRADYSKSTADVLVDVLRFEQDTGASPPQMLADYYYLRKLLRVSTFQLGQVVRNDTEGLQRHMYAMLGSSFVTAPLQFVSDVIAVQTSHERRERLRLEFNSTERNTLRRIWQIKRLGSHSDYRKELGITHREQALIRLSGQRRDMLKPRGRPSVNGPDTCSWRFKTGWPEWERDRNMIDCSIRLMFKEMLQVSGKHLSHDSLGRASPSSETIDHRDLFLQSFEKRPWTSASKACQTQGYIESDNDYTAFIGTGGIRGVIVAEPSTTYQLWQHGGYRGSGIIQIWRFEGTNDCQSGLVVRRYQKERSQIAYTPIGFAFFTALESESSGLDHPVWDDPVTASSAVHDLVSTESVSDGSFSDISDLHDSIWDERHEEICVRLDLPAMLELQRCHVLSQVQMKRIGARWLLEVDAGRTKVKRFDMDLTRR